MPAFVEANADRCDFTSGPAAEAGTRAHGIIDASLLAGIDPLEITDDKALAAGVRWFVDYVNDLEGVYLQAPRVEQEAPRFYNPDLACTPDVVFFKHRHLLDFKNGVVPQPAEGNPQLIIYARSVWGGHLRKFGGEQWTLTIVQPNRLGAGTDENGVDTWVVSGEELWQRSEDILRAYETAMGTEPGDRLVPSQDACLFCPAAAICPARRAAATARLPDLPAAPAKAMTPEQMGAVLQAGEEVRKWLDDVRKAAKKILLDGGEVPGFKLVKGRRSRDWTDADQADLRIRQRHGLKVEDIRTLKSPAQIEAVIKAAGKDPKIDDLVTYTEGAPSMVADKSARPALQDALVALLPD